MEVIVLLPNFLLMDYKIKLLQKFIQSELGVELNLISAKRWLINLKVTVLLQKTKISEMDK